MEWKVRIREAQESDIPIMATFNQAIAWETEELLLEGTIVEAGIRSLFSDSTGAKGQYYLAEGDGRVVGMLLITYEWSDWRNGMFWWIQSVYVDTEFRRRGIFKQLFEFIRSRAAKDPEVCGVRLYVERENQVAQETYQKLGMKETPYRLYEWTEG